MSNAKARWAWLSLLPFAIGAWAPIYAGVRANKRSWRMLGVVWFAMAIIAWILEFESRHPTFNAAVHAASAALLCFAWIGAIVTSFIIRPKYRRLLNVPGVDGPVLGHGVGVGRPDLPDTRDGVLVDNSASAAAIARIPGVGRLLATRSVEPPTAKQRLRVAASLVLPPFIVCQILLVAGSHRPLDIRNRADRLGAHLGQA